MWRFCWSGRPSRRGVAGAFEESLEFFKVTLDQASVDTAEHRSNSNDMRRQTLVAADIRFFHAC